MTSRPSRLCQKQAAITQSNALPVSRRSVRINASVTLVFRAAHPEKRDSRLYFSLGLNKHVVKGFIFIWPEFSCFPNYLITGIAGTETAPRFGMV